ncbi:acidic mammalian chitinase-like [Trachypithecus francoisi]|uniref:acidic mammalian chitinase-like n=1 Tax=Trachypithecus francoisi TaxID=54180 RepID=UPI00141B686B|nr:acidic mammalian chitinase-like [Trachypithecus francoisi]
MADFCCCVSWQRYHWDCLPDPQDVKDYAVNSWKGQGAPAEKLMVGFGAYAHIFTLTNPANHGLDAPTSGPGTDGPYTQEAGTLAYLEVAEYPPLPWEPA